MDKFMNQFDRFLSFFEKIVGGLVMLAMSIVCLIQVIFRFAALPIYWTEETARYLFAWVIYFGCSAALMHNAHFAIDILHTCLPRRMKVVQEVFVQVVCVLGSALLFHYCLTQIEIMIGKPSYSPAASINMLFPYSAPAVGMVLMVLRGIYNIYTIIARYRAENCGGETE